jgi:hypothetical protein
MDNEAHRAYLVREARTTYTAGRERPAPGSLPGAKGGSPQAVEATLASISEE